MSVRFIHVMKSVYNNAWSVHLKKSTKLSCRTCRYSSLTATYPSVVIVGTLVLLVGCGLGAFFGADLPSFKNPGKVTA